MSHYTEAASDWRQFSACREMDDDTFFPSPGDIRGTKQAKEICGQCPVRRACLFEALREEGGRAKENRFGIRGGKTAGQRYAIYVTRRKQQRAAA